MTGPTYLGPEDDDLALFRHGGPEHQVIRQPNGDIVCTGGDLAVGRPDEMRIDFSQAAMITWDQSWWARLRWRIYRWRFRRHLARVLDVPVKLIK